MNKEQKIRLVIISAIIAVLLGVIITALCFIVAKDIPQSGTHSMILSESSLPLATSPVALTEETAENVITLQSNTATFEGAGAKIEGDTVIINRSGVYSVSGKLEGQIIVDASGEDIVIILDGVYIKSNLTSALYVYRANSVTLVLNGETENLLSDAESYSKESPYYNAQTNEPNATIFANSNLVVRGSGSLKILGNCYSGIVCKGGLQVKNTNLDLSSKINGIKTVLGTEMQNSTVKITAPETAVKSGAVSLKNSNIFVYSEAVGIESDTDFAVEDCSISIASSQQNSSLCGFKANGSLTLNGGNILLNCQGDGMIAKGDLTITAGIVNVFTKGEGLRSDSTLKISDGVVSISQSGNGLRGSAVEISGGALHITSENDGIKAYGDNISIYNKITVSGGHIYVNAKRSGLSSAGSIEIADGDIVICGSQSAAGAAVYYAGDFEISGGTLLASGVNAVSKIPANTEQNCIIANFATPVKQDKYAQIKGEDFSFSFKAVTDIQSVLFSSPELLEDEEYTLGYSGKYSGGEGIDSVYTNGKYSGGKKYKFTLSEGLNNLTID